MGQLDVKILPARTDNYIFLIYDHKSDTSGVVDPADAEPVVQALESAGRKLDWIVNTHHHNDHIGGNVELKLRYGARIAAPAADKHRISNVDLWLDEKDLFQFGSHHAIVLSTPGHTSGHISLWFEEDHILFCGDTLFALGCGRLFEGTPAQMWNSLGKYRSIPDQTKVYCGHEYTQANLAFAMTVDPCNPDLKERFNTITEARRRNEPTVPTELGIERSTNPFLRPHDPNIRAELGMPDASDADVFAEIRRRKDHF